MTSSETSSQQQQQLSSSMHLQCVQGCLLVHHSQHHPDQLSSTNYLSTYACPVANNHHPTFSTAPNNISVADQSVDASASSLPHHHEFPINNNNTTSSKSAFVNSSAAVLSTNHNNNETLDPTGSLTTSSLSVSPSPSGASSTYLSCCSNLSVNGQGGGTSLKISDNHLSTKSVRNSSAPYVINKQHNKPAVVGGDELSGNVQRDPTTASIGMGSTAVNGSGFGGGVSVICGMNGSGGNANLIKVEPNGNTIDMISVDNPLLLTTMHLHHSSNGTNGGAHCCHHNLGPINHFSGGGIPTPTSNGIIENCDLDISNNGNNSEMSNGGVVPMDTVFARLSHDNGNQCSHADYSTSPNNSNTLVSPLLSSSSAPPGMTMVSCNSSNCNGNGVGATNTTTTTIALNGGTNGPCVGNNMSPGEDVDEHDCDDDKVINGDTYGVAGELPDPDSITMFVGQIPKHMNETDLRELFEKYGRVYQINVLRDKATKQSKGCCFVTFFTRKAALDAQNALHNVKTLPGMNNTVQMKPADNENRYDRKLFIGMISKKLNETDVRNMFSRFGTIDDCTVLRLPTGESRGCAFVTFSTKQSAQNAIKAVHQSITMEGCSSAIVVKFADTPKDKDQKRQTQIVTSPANLLSTLSSTTIAPVQQQYYSAILHHQLQQQQQPQQGGFFSQLSPLGVQGITGIGGLGSTSATGLPGLGSANLSSTNTDLAALTGLLSGVTQSPHSLTVQNLHTLAALGNSSLSPTGASVSSVESGTSIANLTGSGLQSGLTSYHAGLRSTAVSAKQQTEGPEGCNLFIYHLPPECGDAELAQMFISFGTVLSAKVFIDKQTNLSKCFGFVSFDNQLSAQMAIQAMNGFQVGMKRLKVQLKRSKSKDAAKPY